MTFYERLLNFFFFLSSMIARRTCRSEAEEFLVTFALLMIVRISVRSLVFLQGLLRNPWP